MEENINLEHAVQDLDKAENDVKTIRNSITKYLVENGLNMFFSVDWSKLKREHGLADKHRRVKR
jgi:hypothetical protein